VERYIAGELSLAALCRQYGISRKTGNKWVRRYEREGLHALEDRSREAKTHPNEVSPEIEAWILKGRGKHPTWGPKKLVAWVKEKGGFEKVCAVSTAGEILHRHGLTTPRTLTKKNEVWALPLTECAEANRVWCVDFKGWFRLGNGRRCEPLTITDGCSRYLIKCQALERTDLETTKRVFEATFREYGLPEWIRSDNGTPFSSIGLGGFSVLSLWWLKLGISHERIEPGKPYQNGRHERMHLTLKRETTQPSAFDLRAQQRRFNVFRQVYNHERPHEALGQKTPASVYQPSTREYTGRFIVPVYASETVIRKVQKCGEFKWEGHRVFFGEAFAGESIAFEPQEDGIWGIRFGCVWLGSFDERSLKIKSASAPHRPRARP
jgi:putative transposase